MQMEEVKEVGSKIGMSLRDGTTAAVGSTDRIKGLNQKLHNSRPNLEIQRTRVLTEYFKAHESESQLRKRYFALAKVYETLPIFIVEGERLLGWQGSRIRSNNFSIESHAHWLEQDIPTLETRSFDPWKVSEEDKQELLNMHIPYWRNLTLTSKWRAQTSQPDILSSSGYVDASNFISNPGSHYSPDSWTLLKIGFKGYSDQCQEYLSKLDLSVPENVGKKDFYEGLIALCEGIQKYGRRLSEAAIAESKKTDDPVRKKELIEAAGRCKKITWLPPETFVEALHLIWLVTMFLNIETSGPAIGLGRFDQYMWPFLREDLIEGKLTVEEVLEWMEEFNIKCCNYPWLLPENLCKYFGGYYRWTGQYCVGGVDKDGENAVNLLSYICLRSSRNTRTTAPPIHVLLSSKNPDSFLEEAIKLAAEGLGHPSFFDVESIHNMLRHRGTSIGNSHKSPFTEEEINLRGCTTGCVEPIMDGYNHGHANANITNVGNTLSVTLNNGVLPRQCPGFGAGTVVGRQTGDPREFKTFDELYEAVLNQFRYQVDLCHEHLLVCEKLIAEEHQMPLCTLLSSGTLKKGKDLANGGAKLSMGPAYDLSGIADLADSMIAIKKLVYDEKRITMDQLLDALDADFEGYEEIRKMCLKAPKYGNDFDEPDQMVDRLLRDFSEYVGTKKCWRSEYYSDAGIQPTQANVANGQMCWALPNGRKGLQPFADAMSAEQGKDVNGPLAAIRSYAKVKHDNIHNGTLLNMWISKSEFFNEY